MWTAVENLAPPLCEEEIATVLEALPEISEKICESLSCLCYLFQL